MWVLETGDWGYDGSGLRAAGDLASGANGGPRPYTWPMRARVLFGLAFVLSAVIPLAIYVTVRATRDSVVQPPTQDELRAELLELGTKSGSATFRVELRTPGQTVIWYQDGSLRTRLDLRYGGADGVRRERTFVESGSAYFSCREPGLCAQGTTELFDYGSDQAQLEGLGTVLLFGIQSFGDGLVEAQLTRRTERIADVSGACFTFAQTADYEEEVCFDERGTPLRLKFTYGEPRAGGLMYEAVDVGYAVDDADFEPPYPLVP